MSRVVHPRARTAAEGLGTVLLTVFLLIGALLLLVLAISVAGNVITQIVYGSIILVLLGLAAALQLSNGQGLRRALSAGQLGPYFGLSTALIFGATSLIWAGGPPSDQVGLISDVSIISGMVLVAVALICFVVGYRAAPRGPVGAGATWLRHVVVTDRPIRFGQGAAWLLLSVALVGDLALFLLGNFGYLSNPALDVTTASPITESLTILGSFSVFAVGLSANDYARRRGLRRLGSFVLLLAAQTGVGALSGAKESVALGLVAALLGWGASARRFPLVPMAASVLAFVFLVVPFVTNYRDVINVGNSRLSPGAAVAALGEQGIASFISSAQSGGGQSPQEQTLLRISRIGDVAIIVQKTPSQIPYRPVSELLEAPVLGLIPRALWPGKPILDAGYLFSQQYYELPADVYTSSAVTPEGDLWRHGGWPIVIAGMLLIGAGVRVLDAATADVSRHPLRLLLVLSFFTLIVKQEIDVVSLVASIPSLLLGVAVAARLVTKRNSTMRQTTPVSAPRHSLRAQ